MQNDIVALHNEKPFTTSRILACGCGLEHVAVLQLVRKYADDVREVGETFTFEMRKFKTGGRSGEEAILDETQATFIITLMKNSKIVVQFKKQLTKAFFEQRETISRLISQRKDSDWQNVRKDGKHVYFQKTDVIKQFVEYAKGQGSQSAERYYCNLAKMENKALFFFDEHPKNVREALTVKQLMQVATADWVIEKALQDGMTQQLHYKDCYKLVKENIIAYVEIIGQSPVLALTLRGKGAEGKAAALGG